MTYTNEEIEFLIKNYPTKGIEYCSNKLNRTKNSISCKSHYLGLKLNMDIKSGIYHKNAKNWSDKRDDSLFNVGIEQFKNIATPEIAYILGILWSDGHVVNKGIGNSNVITLEAISEDMNNIKFVFDSTGKWNYAYSKRSKYKEQLNIYTSNRPLCDYLSLMDFNKKSYTSPDKILNKIPNNLKKYFFRGISDGDGCFYIGKYCHQYTVSSTVDQDWNYLSLLFKSLNIKYTIRKNQHKNKKGNYSQSSYIKISNMPDVIKFGNYIYDGYLEDRIGLYRKYDKFLDIKSHFELHLSK